MDSNKIDKNGFFIIDGTGFYAEGGPWDSKATEWFVVC